MTKDLTEARRSKYLILRPDPGNGDIVVESFKNKFELESYLNGCSNPSECVPLLRLELECIKFYRVKGVKYKKKKKV